MAVAFIPEGLAGERLDVAAARMLGVSRTLIAELAAAGKVRVDGVALAKSDRVVAGALLDVDLADNPKEVRVVPQLVSGIKIVYDDRDIVVVDKPVGVTAHPSLGWDGPSVTEHLAAAGFQISTSGASERQGVVQRLDVGTSGLMVLAKSELAYSVLKQAFRQRSITKVYHALVQGHPDPFFGTIDAPIGRAPGHEWKMAVVAGGRESVTHYETLEALRCATLLKVHLETGRTHQIRVHMAAVKHPCVGDPLYGADPVLARRLGLQRQWLHAKELGFEHPRSGDWVEFSSDYPDDLVYSLGVLRSES